MAVQRRVASYKVFRGVMATWDDLFSRAAEFATSVGPERLITIGHSEDKDDGVIAVWYWADPPHTQPGGRRSARQPSSASTDEGEVGPAD